MAKRRPGIKIKNYETYQHYKHRNPPWVKLHLSLLDDPDFLRLPDASKWHYVGLILLASRHNNYIQFDVEYIKNRLGLTDKLNLTPRFLIDHVLACSASNTLASSVSVLDCSTLKCADSEKSRDRVETEKSRDGVEAGILVPLKRKRATLLSDDEFFESLKTNPAYGHIDLITENGKMDAWFSLPKNRHRKKTRQFVLNWLNKIEKPMHVNGEYMTDPSGMMAQYKAFIERG